ncbi:hypothetical protein [Hydrogenothermus marinus]|uniref:Uncharacterized protein n=1 Tax=Hydrogenothermus marinus TaxID=133270 RepID=A0A3M0BUH4_9AQUI|nr:hypothetical protein [Hydrogenothermus marinus]RMB00067.1 hypothetical protein CLV39_0036 [Hydrogenothermus marinus]
MIVIKENGREKEPVNFIYYKAPNGKRALTNTEQIVSYEHVEGNEYILYIRQNGIANILARDLGGEVVSDGIVKLRAEVDPRTEKYLPKDKEGIKIEGEKETIK